MPEAVAPQRSIHLPGVEIRGPVVAGEDVVLTSEALSFVADLVRRFGARREALLAHRREMQKRFDAGERPHFRTETAHVREGEWTVAPIPADLLDRRVEITGPADRKMIINALNSGASVFMADFEDSNSPTWENLVTGQQNLRDAVRRTITFEAAGKGYRLKDRTAVLMCRPRGWHLLEKHVTVDGKPIPASLFDFGLYFFHNARELLSRGTGPYFYLPKLESHLEARLWNDVFVRAQEALRIPRGSIRATCLVETLPAAFEMDEILYELREHSAGLNCGRWDYIFSFIKKLGRDPATIVPDRKDVTMDKGFLDAYVRLLIRTCHRRGAHAMGGMAAQIPIKDDPAANEAALAKVRADKLREVKAGHDGTWVAHPGLVPVAKELFDAHMRGPNQLHVKRADVSVEPRDLLEPPAGARTQAGLRHSIRVAVQYLEAWLRGNGCVPIYDLMEDAATVEIARAQVWQWIFHGVSLDDGTKVTATEFRRILGEELERIRLEVGEAAFARGKFEEARGLFERMSTSHELADFLTLPAYDLLVGERLGIRADAIQAEESAAPAHADPHRWEGIARPYARRDVERLRGSVRIEHTLAQLGAQRLWDLLKSRPYVHALGALTGNQAVQMVKGGLEAIYLSGWQVAADANTAGQTYPDQSLYPYDSVPTVVRRINRAFQRADQIAHSEGRIGTWWYAPIVADAEAGFGGPLNAYELMKAMIEAGAAAVHFEDQLASEKKCGHLGGKVLVPTSQFVRTLVAARLAADVMGVPTILVARTDADSAKLLLSDVDPYDSAFIDRSRPRTPEGFFPLRGGVECAIHRALAYAPYADLLWCETSTPDLEEARRFAEGVHAKFPGKMLAYNCSPSFNWRKNLDEATIARFQRELGAMGYKFQFVTLAGFHALNHAMFALARDYRDRGMAAYSELQQREFTDEKQGYTAVRHQAEVGTGYFDEVATVISGGQSSTTALKESTEAAQFHAILAQADRAAAALAHADALGGRAGIAAAKEALEKEHEEIEEIAARLRASRDVPAILATLEELASGLAAHFEREERDHGILGVLGSVGADRSQLESLRREHEQLLRHIQEVASAGRGAQSAQELGGRALQIAAQLREHEIREHTLALAALGKGFAAA
jgi:malate synthase A